MKVVIIGSGLGSLSAAIRIAAMGSEVKVFEKNESPGGKLTQFCNYGYRFDKGPSLLTLPNLIDELTEISKSDRKFNYKRLKIVTHYFFEDGTFVKSFADKHLLAKELQLKLGEAPQHVLNYLKRSEFFYNTTADIFLQKSLHQLKNHFSFKTLKGVLNSWRLQLFSSMNTANKKQFKNKKTIQLFNRYATYNGSNPYKAPALLNMIPHLEFNLGAFIPDKGMYAITQHLYDIAKDLGVKFYFNHEVESIELEDNTVKGIKTNGVFFEGNVVISDADMHVVYEKLLPKKYLPKKLLAQEKSSSAFIFYWGISKQFDQLDLHNVFFSDNYEEEFNWLFKKDKPYVDPTVYVNISSKYCKDDAPEGCENWFVMVNAPHNKTHQSITYKEELRKNIIAKINRILNTDIEPLIQTEEILDPYGIEMQTSSYGGSLYGNSSNNKFSAFLRHANYSSKIKGLYFCGGSVHPGGGIPLSLLSGKIAANLVIEKNKARL